MCARLCLGRDMLERYGIVWYGMVSRQGHGQLTAWSGQGK